MSWVNGRQLASASDGTSTYSYIYDAAGSRIMKNVGTVNHLYFYVNGMLLMEYRYNAMGDTTDVLQYFYDANGKPHAMAYNGTVYLYVTNLQGDIVALLGLDGTVSGYEYDPYGNVIASYGDIAAINPLRYRGYYYDNETGLYYLQSRYYDPAVGRFINADSYASTGQRIIGYNMFVYCNNNPLIYTDFFGDIPVVDAFIHQEVLKEISSKNQSLSYKNTYIKYRDENGSYTGRWGFCDLYNTKTGEVWELKKNSNSTSCKSTNAQKQLDRYINGELVADKDLSLTRPYITDIPSGRITKDTLYCSYDIHYWDEGNGILRYDYSISLNKGRIAQTAIIIGIAAVTGFSPIGIAGAIGTSGLLPA